MGYVSFLKKPWFYRNLLAEFLGTFFLVSVQCAVPLFFDSTTFGGVMQVGLAMGFVLMVNIEAFGHFSGGHYNPAVTCGMMVGRKINIVKGVFYIITQVLAGIVAAYFIKGVTPKQFRDSLSATTVHPDIDSYLGMFIEAWLTALLMFVIFGATDSNRKNVFMPSIPIGLTVALDIMTAGVYTGASMNPARSLGPAIAMDIFDDHWVYWVGPIGGAIFASIIYNYVLTIVKEEETEEDFKGDDHPRI